MRPQIAVGPVMLATALLTVKVRAALIQVLLVWLVAVTLTWPVVKVVGSTSTTMALVVPPEVMVIPVGTVHA